MRRTIVETREIVNDLDIPLTVNKGETRAESRSISVKEVLGGGRWGGGVRVSLAVVRYRKDGEPSHTGDRGFDLTEIAPSRNADRWARGIWKAFDDETIERLRHAAAEALREFNAIDWPTVTPSQ